MAFSRAEQRVPDDPDVRNRGAESAGDVNIMVFDRVETSVIFKMVVLEQDVVSTTQPAMALIIDEGAILDRHVIKSGAHANLEAIHQYVVDRDVRDIGAQQLKGNLVGVLPDKVQISEQISFELCVLIDQVGRHEDSERK